MVIFFSYVCFDLMLAQCFPALVQAFNCLLLDPYEKEMT